MNDNELNAYADKIFTSFFCTEAKNKSRDELTSIIKKTVIDIYQYGKSIGGNKILNHFQIEIDNIKSNQ